MCPCSNLYHIFNNNYNNNYSFVILKCLQPFCKPHFLVILHTWLFVFLLTNFSCKLYTYSLDLHNTQLHSRLTELPLTLCLLYLVLLYAHTFSLQNVLKVEDSRSRLLERFIAHACIFAFSYLSVRHACCW